MTPHVNAESKCLSCKRFWKICNDENEKCYRGGSNGGLIHYCTGYEPTITNEHKEKNNAK